VRVTSSGGFPLRKVFCIAASRLIGHDPKARIFDGRIEMFLAGRHIETLPRGRVRGRVRSRAPNGGRGARAHVINCRHVIHSLRRKPRALADLACRDQLFPRTEHRRCREALEAGMSRAAACRVMVGLLWPAHGQGCEAEPAAALAAIPDAGALPDPKALQVRFRRSRPEPDDVPVNMPAAATCDALPASQGVAA